MKNKLLIFTIAVFCFTITSHQVFAEADPTKYGKVTDISSSDSVKSGTGSNLDVVITGNETSNVVVDYGKNKGIILKYVDSNSNGRPDNTAWLGIHVSVPSSITARDAKFSVNGGSEKSIESDGNYYFGITLEKLKEASEKGEAITYTYTFKWSSSDTQTITINIYPKAITLLNKNSVDELWTPEDALKDDMPETGDSLSILFLVFSLLLCVGVYNLILIKPKKIGE